MSRASTLIAIAAAAIAPFCWAAGASAAKDRKQVRYVRIVANGGYYVDNDPSGTSGGDCSAPPAI